MTIELLHIDCMQYMAKLPDRAFDLAIVDPPYGIGVASQNNKKRGKLGSHYENKNWDDSAPEQEYFEQLVRVSSNQIVWGANHFADKLPCPKSPCWIVWNKMTVGNTADCELAFSSFKTAVRRFDFMWEGFWQGDMKNKEQRIHPTQKPVKLYEWLLTNYAKPGDRILDTHLGSGSSAIAAHNLGFDFVGCELDRDYYEAALARFNKHKAQGSLFAPEQIAKPETLELGL
jgi:site-specific DNA-methyltransferase (adenine-specific)